MIARARRVWPGMLVTMLLAGPVIAAPAQAATSPDRQENARHDHARPEHARQEHARLEHARHPAHHAPYKTAGRSKPRLLARRRTPLEHLAAPSAAPAHTTAFIDDGFSYLESRAGRPAWKQTGVASWYGGSRWHGKQTSSGATYDQNALTAAHATLPMGSKIRVALHHSDKFVVVTITDRPGTRSRIIDLSRGAAEALGILDRGVAMVTLSPQ